ncbi:hypothetical protein H072_707 [Dactylellina haptotyla CBS 200.50]|uniref:Amino acid permease/ SLC12A domain-containing protein n=1 Tax=Dactylellina haptotyla (strain CBS 200.50) TaxID=1284197 RepID=S8C0N6_DACHA|nr:hypothetical protein H072_707 [Dactylellina haptotyla CBS 200.50]
MAFQSGYQQPGMGQFNQDPVDIYAEQISEEERKRATRANLEFTHFNYIDEDKLGYISVFCIIVNRMIGTGIFEQPSTILAGCGSLGASLFLWALGAIIAFSGLMVHIEFGLTIPRYPDPRSNNRYKPIPRSGGEKNYFEFLFRRQKLLPQCIYAVTFVFLGNTAGNAIVFADYFLRMVGVQDPSASTPWGTKAVAVAVISFACFAHSIWRKGGIFLLNILAIIKIFILWTIIVLGYAARAGHFESVLREDPPAWESFEPSEAFHGRSTGLYGWTIAILSVLFAFGGYENANYVLSEIKNPKVVFPRATITALVFTAATYILTIASYYLVIPVEMMFPDQNGTVPKPILLFFGTLFNNNSGVKQGVSALVALSSFGNLMTVTFVASRVKQEIAKEGILPWYEFWQKDWDSGYRLFTDMFTALKDKNPATKATRKDKTPTPALLLHWGTSLILILAPPERIAYQLFTRMYTYMIQACFGAILGGGLLYLRYIKPLSNKNFKWKKLAKNEFNVWKPLRPIFPLIYFVSTTFLIIAPFIQHGDSGDSKISQSSALQWYIFPTVCLSLFGVGTIYWIIIAFFIPFFFQKELFRQRDAEINLKGNLEWEGVKAKWLPVDAHHPPGQEDDPELPTGKSR